MKKTDGGWRQRARPSLLSAMLCLSGAVLLVPTAESGNHRPESATRTAAKGNESAAQRNERQRVVSLTFRQIGAWSSLRLRGVDGSQTLGFSIRADEVVVGAKLRIAYDYSPALLPELSHLRILLNDRIVAVEPLPQGRGVGNAREVALDPRVIGEYNELRFNLIGHYTRQCEDPFHSSLWLNVSDLSRLELTLAPVPSSNDLKFLPAPFFDNRDNAPLNLPFVFAETPSFGSLNAAGVVSSWFGMLAGARGAQFPALLNALPDGNAVVFLRGEDVVANLRATPGSSVSVQPHPANPNAKLLVISGNDDEAIMRAARAVALVSPTLTGQTVSVTRQTETAQRKPNDAPAWVPTDRPVRFGELARPQDLRVQGYQPGIIRLNYRVPPDVFAWRTPGVPLKLKYRAIRLPEHRNSSLGIALNASYIDTLALNDGPLQTNGLVQVSTANPSVREARLHLPPYAVGGRDQLQLAYAFDMQTSGECKLPPPDNLEGSIDAESTIDFSSFPRYAVLPNLNTFSKVGFPFTRMADLSETTIILPERPNADEASLYLTLLGRMGESTGYPAIRHTLAAPSDLAKAKNNDLIVIGSAESQVLMSDWSEHLPMVQAGNERRVRTPVKSWMPSYRWDRREEEPTPTTHGSLSLVGTGAVAAIMGAESPLQSARSVVVLYADRSRDLRKIGDFLIDPARNALIQGDLAIIDDKMVNHTRVGPTYSIGSLPFLSKVRWFFADYPLLAAFLLVLACVLLATLIYRPLRRLVARRSKKRITV